MNEDKVLREMAPEELSEASRYIRARERWCKECPEMAQMIDRARESLTELETLMVQGYVVVDERPERSPIYVVRAPDWITSEYREKLLDVIKALGGGYLLTDATTIEVY